MSVLRVRDGATLRGDYTLRGETAAAPPPPPAAEPLTYPEFWVKYNPSSTGYGQGVLPSAMTDITADVMSMEWSRGRSAALDEVGAGSATLRLRNESRQWEPGFAAGPYNPIVMGETFVIGCTWLGGDYTLFYGFSESVDVIWDVNWGDVHSEVEIRLVDALALMTRAGSASAPLQELGSVRIGKTLDFGLLTDRFPTTMRNLSGGALCVQHTTTAGAPHGLEYIHMVVKTSAEDRPFWIDRRGYATYTGTTATGLVFGDDLDAGEFKYSASRLHLGKEQMLSSVSVSLLAGGTVTAAVTGVHTGQHHSRSTLSVSSAAAQTLANSLISQYQTPRLKMEGFRVMPGGNEDLWSAVIPMDLERTFTVRRRPPGGGTMFSQLVKVGGLKWSVQGHPLKTTIDYSLIT